MRRTGWWVTTVCALSVLTMAGCEPKPEGPADSAPAVGADLLTNLVARERSFARAANADGVQSAFTAFLAPNGIIFRPGPVEAGPWLQQNDLGSFALQWVPTGASIASSQDLGYTTGPYIATEEGGAEHHGHYVSVWQAGEDGAFQVILDIGAPTPEAGPLPESPEVITDLEVVGLPPSEGSPGASDPQPFEALKAVDRGYAVEQATSGSASALTLYAAPSVRVHRPGRFPMVGAGTSEAALANERFSTSPLDGKISLSGTLGYVYGSVALPGGAQAGNYLRIWRRDPGASWALALELIDVQPE